MPTAADIVKDPTWLPAAFDRGSGTIRFAKLPREALAGESFLDQRMAGAATQWADLPSSAVTEAVAATGKPKPPAFIFHTSFCCSTLIARALDAPGAVLALKEPNILLDIANAARADERWKHDAQAFARLVDAVIALLARPHPGETSVVIKPTNAANSLIHFAVGAGAPVLLLHGGLKDYLISILKKGEEGRAFVRAQFNIFSHDGGGLSAIPQRQAMAFTDLQVAALVWRHQIEAFAATLSTPKTCAASLDYRRLLDDPAEILKAAALHLALALGDERIERAARSDIFAKDAKFTDRDYDAATRGAEEAAFAERWKGELDLILNWAAGLNLGVAAKLPLSRSL